MRRGYNPGEDIKLDLGKMEFDYTGQAQAIFLPRGKYYLQCWGAQGGLVTNNYNAPKVAGNKLPDTMYYWSDYSLGGYSAGYITLPTPTILYVYVGGAGVYNTYYAGTPIAGFNGGGNVENLVETHTNGNLLQEVGSPGGGATDIRVGEDSLFSRVIVAGGGGGGNSNNTSYSNPLAGGDGGGVTAATAYQVEEEKNYGGPGGSQNGNVYVYGLNYSTAEAGTFGNGANGKIVDEDEFLFPGGGGWFGGGVGQPYNGSYFQYGGGGGSGYIYNAENAQYYPNGCLLTPTYYLQEGVSICQRKDTAVTDSTYWNTLNTIPFPDSMPDGITGHGYCTISGYASYNVDEDDEILIYYTNSGTYEIPSGYSYADIFLVNGGNGGSASTASSRWEGFGGQGGNYYSATNINLLTSPIKTHAVITIGAGGTSGKTGGKTTLLVKNSGSTSTMSWSPSNQSTATTYATTGYTAQSGVLNPFNPLDTNYYGAAGGMGYYDNYITSGNYVYPGRRGGGTGGGRGAVSTSRAYYAYNRYYPAGNGSFYGAGGGGGACYNSGDKLNPGEGYQGICVIKWKKTTS